PCLVEVIRNGEVQDSVRLTRFRRRFFYAFERDCCYTLRVSKPGFAPMLIAVDTRIPMDNVLYRFDFSARLITEKRAKTFDHETLQLPYAQITFDKTAGGFLADASYAETIKTRLALRGSVR